MNITSQTWMEIQMVVALLNRRTGRMVGDRGEGVISTAIPSWTNRHVPD